MTGHGVGRYASHPATLWVLVREWPAVMEMHPQADQKWDSDDAVWVQNRVDARWMIG